jgi:hypothetical protein
VLAAAALVVGVTAIVTVKREPAPTPPPEKQLLIADDLLVTDADKALCEEIGPLLKEQTDRGRAFINTGVPESPERRVATRTFKADTVEWYVKIQKALNSHQSRSAT